MEIYTQDYGFSHIHLQFNSRPFFRSPIFVIVLLNVSAKIILKNINYIGLSIFGIV